VLIRPAHIAYTQQQLACPRKGIAANFSNADKESFFKVGTLIDKEGKRDLVVA